MEKFWKPLLAAVGLAAAPVAEAQAQDMPVPLLPEHVALQGADFTDPDLHAPLFGDAGSREEYVREIPIAPLAKPPRMHIDVPSSMHIPGVPEVLNGEVGLVDANKGQVAGVRAAIHSNPQN